jgi:putative spermidine/putrescine transport system substrate-binding protein
MQNPRSINRRAFLTVAAAGIAMPSIVRAQQRELVIAGWGGLYEQASKAAFYDPFAKATGVRIRQVSAVAAMYAQLKAQVENNNPEVDIFNLGSELMLRGGKAGLLAPIDLNIVKTDKLYPKAVNEFGVAMDMYGVGIAYNTGSFPSGKQPKNYAEYWDASRFPGRRTAPGWSPRDNLEVALMADGMALDKLYPLDIDRAFKVLERMKPQTTWYSSGSMETQLFADKAVVLGYGYLGRVNVLARSGLPLATGLNQAIYSFTNWNVSKVSGNKQIAMEFINFASQAPQQAQRSVLYPEGPINRDAWALIPEYLHATLPQYEASNIIFRDDAWWEANGAALEERWKLWLAS